MKQSEVLQKSLCLEFTLMYVRIHHEVVSVLPPIESRIFK